MLLRLNINQATFGSPMPNRSFSASSYKYGFNGKEKDEEVKGEGNSLDFGDRIFDSRLGRWLGIDKKHTEYVSISTYAFSMNSPIQLKDIDGNLLVDQNGNIIYTKSGEPSRSEAATKSYVKSSVKEASGNISTTTIKVTPIMQDVTIYTNDGVAVNASMLVGYDVFESTVVTNDKDVEIGEPVMKKVEFNSLSSSIKGNLSKESAGYDCHGLTFTKGLLWIDDDQAQKIIDSEGIPLQGPNGASFVTYDATFTSEAKDKYELGLVHTTPIKKDGSVDSKRGGTKLVTNSTVAIEKAAYSGKEVVDGLEGSTKIKTKYYGKKENKKIDIGTVGDKGLNNATGNEKLKQHVK